MTDPVELSSPPLDYGKHQDRILTHPSLLRYIKDTGLVSGGAPSSVTKPQGTVKLQNQPRWRVLPTGGRDLSNDEKLEMLHRDAVNVTVEHFHLLGVQPYNFGCARLRQPRADSSPELEV